MFDHTVEACTAALQWEIEAQEDGWQKVPFVAPLHGFKYHKPGFEAYVTAVHPPAGKARELRGEPKTEMWFITDAAPEASLYVGLKRFR